MEGAALCFQERGFAATSIDWIAVRIGSTKGRIYHHFPSKADLFFEVYRAGMEMSLAGIQPHLAEKSSPASRLRKMLKAHVLSMIRTQPFQRVVWEGVEMLRQNALPEPHHQKLGELAALRQDYADHFRRVMEDAKAEGDLDYDHVSIAINTMLMAVNGPVFWFRPREGQTDSEIEAIADECAQYAMAALGARKAAKGVESHDGD